MDTLILIGIVLFVLIIILVFLIIFVNYLNKRFNKVKSESLERKDIDNSVRSEGMIGNDIKRNKKRIVKNSKISN